MTSVMLACGACGPAHDRDSDSVPGTVAVVEPWFALRGRWNFSDEIVVGLYAGDTEADLEAAFGTAAAGWNELGGPQLRLARAEETPQLWISFERGVHGPCAPFGRDSTRAHAGPLEDPTWIHLDAGRDFDGEDLPLARVVAHELGHVLGLDHVEDPSSLMATDPAVDRPGPTDVAAIHSLYGGGRAGPADLHVGQGQVLRGVAPREKVEFAVFDVHADGRDELLLWRTDPAGRGRVLVLGFDEELRPRGSYLLEGVVLPGAPLWLVADGDVRRVVIPREAVPPLVLEFNDEGRLRPVQDVSGVPSEAPPRRTAGDLDGDGRVEEVRRAP